MGVSSLQRANAAMTATTHTPVPRSAAIETAWPVGRATTGSRSANIASTQGVSSMDDAIGMSSVAIGDPKAVRPCSERTAFDDSAASDRGRRGLVDAEVGRDDDPVVLFCSASRYEPVTHVIGDGSGVPAERIAVAAPSTGLVDEDVACFQSVVAAALDDLAIGSGVQHDPVRLALRPAGDGPRLRLRLIDRQMPVAGAVKRYERLTPTPPRC